MKKRINKKGNYFLIYLNEEAAKRCGQPPKIIERASQKHQGITLDQFYRQGGILPPGLIRIKGKKGEVAETRNDSGAIRVTVDFPLSLTVPEVRKWIGIALKFFKRQFYVPLEPGHIRKPYEKYKEGEYESRDPDDPKSKWTLFKVPVKTYADHPGLKTGSGYEKRKADYQKKLRLIKKTSEKLKKNRNKICKDAKVLGIAPHKLFLDKINNELEKCGYKKQGHSRLKQIVTFSK